MYEAQAYDTDEAWRARAGHVLRGRLGGADLVALVIDGDEPGVLAACGAASIGPRLPGPQLLTASVAYVQWVVTDPRYRRRGLARAVLTALLDALRERGVDMVELHASPEGEPLYRSLGFTGPPTPQFRLPLRPPDEAPDARRGARRGARRDAPRGSGGMT